MLRKNSVRPIRTTLNLADETQVKSVRKRLRISDTDLVRIVDKIGNSLAAIQKEVDLQRVAALGQSSSNEASSVPALMSNEDGEMR